MCCVIFRWLCTTSLLPTATPSLTLMSSLLMAGIFTLQTCIVREQWCELFFLLHTVYCSRRYENYQVGTFVLYKSSAGLLEVHVRQWECGSVVAAASCACGFAARDSGSGEVVALDMCGGEMGESRAHLSVKQSGGASWNTVRIAESYQGRKVTVSSRPGLLSKC